MTLISFSVIHYYSLSLLAFQSNGLHWLPRVLDVLEHLELLASLEETKVATISWKEEVADYVQVSGGI